MFETLPLLGLVIPIVHRACRCHALLQFEDDIRQEVFWRLLSRLERKEPDTTIERYIRKTARLESWKLCKQEQLRRSRERSWEVETLADSSVVKALQYRS